MPLSEEAMCFLEAHIPELATVAFQQAYWSALASGSSVLISEICQIFVNSTDTGKNLCWSQA